MGTRRNFSAAFKAKVALEALVGDKSLAELAAKHAVHPNMITQWKRQAKESLPEVFAKKSSRGSGDHEGEVKSLHAKIGQLTVENDFFVEGLRSMSRDRRAGMIDADHPRLSISRQCKLVDISRSSHYYTAKGESPLNVQLMRLIDEQYLSTPWYGARQMASYLRRQGYPARRKRIGRLMRVMGLSAIYRKPRTSIPHPGHKVYPYLLRDLRIDQPDQVWCADITYIPMERGFQYLVAIMDWATRAVLSWRLSNTLDSDFCVEALEEAMARYGRPGIFNTDQGCQFTSEDFTGVLKLAGVQISMDGKRRWMDNVFIERLWRSLKYECVYLHAFQDGSQARQQIGAWVQYYNHQRPHSSHADDRTPMEVYTRKRAA